MKKFFWKYLGSMAAIVVFFMAGAIGVLWLMGCDWFGYWIWGRTGEQVCISIGVFLLISLVVCVISYDPDDFKKDED